MSTTFGFPSTFDNPQSLTTLLGGFWPTIYGGSDLINNYAKACLLSEQQLYNNILEVVATLDNKTCPVLHTVNWYNLPLLQSQMVAGAGYSVTFPIPAELIYTGYAANDILSPTVVLTKDVSYQLNTTTDLITLTGNPFTDSRFTSRPVMVNGAVTDQRIDLWFFKAGIERQYLYQQFGYVFNLNLASTQRYKDLLNALWRATTQGTSGDDIALAIEAITDAPRVKSQSETVKVISSDAGSVLVITDKNVYRFALNATPIVTVGQLMNIDDQLTDVVQIITPNTGVMPTGLTSLVIPNSFFDPSVLGSLTWTNASTPLIVQTGVSGFTKVSWALGGAAGDVTNFFTAMHTKGVAAGKTLANYLDIRPQPQATQPTALNLPTTINPLQFLSQNVLRYNAYIVIIKTSKLGPDALGTKYLSVLRQIQPPHTAMIQNLL